MKVKEFNKNDPELYNIWNDKRIKEAFNFGNGTKKDMLNYMKNNKNVGFKILEE